VIVSYEGTTKLLDFGVARLVALDGSRTVTVRGKPAYLAPEQIQAGRIDRRTDVFALGVILHELLTGRRLFKRDTPDASYAAILVGEIPDVHDLRPDLPPALTEIASRALRREISERFATAEELRQRIVDVAATLDLAIAPPLAVGAWVRRVVPPTFEPADLERELALGLPTGAAPSDIFDLPTLAPGLPSSPPSRRALREARGWKALAIGAALLALGGAVVALRTRATRRETAPAPSSTIADDLAPTDSASPAVGGEVEPTSGKPPSVPEPRVPSTTAVRRRARDRAPEPAAPTAPPSTASSGAHLSVWSSVWGTVSVDGANVGDSPIIDVTLAAGRHVVSVQTAQGIKQQSVLLSPGESGKVRFVF